MVDYCKQKTFLMTKYTGWFFYILTLKNNYSEHLLQELYIFGNRRISVDQIYESFLFNIFYLSTFCKKFFFAFSAFYQKSDFFTNSEYFVYARIRICMISDLNRIAVRPILKSIKCRPCMVIFGWIANDSLEPLFCRVLASSYFSLSWRAFISYHDKTIFFEQRRHAQYKLIKRILVAFVSCPPFHVLRIAIIFLILMYFFSRTGLFLELMVLQWRTVIRNLGRHATPLTIYATNKSILGLTSFS
jgi:hypothetical protein